MTIVNVQVAKPRFPCWCGCGGTTQSRFVPGHDGRFHGWAKKVARGTISAEEAEALMAKMPHDQARAHFRDLVEAERPFVEAWRTFQAAKAAHKQANLAVRVPTPAETLEQPADEPVIEEVAEEAVS